jgi:hypothetical protein
MEKGKKKKEKPSKTYIYPEIESRRFRFEKKRKFQVVNRIQALY